MGSDDFDYSYYRNLRSSRGSRREPPKRERSTSRFRFGRYRRATNDLKGEIKRLLILEPDISVSGIIARLDFGITVSRTTVSVVMTEFRHTMKFLGDRGLLK